MSFNPKTNKDEILGFRFNPLIVDWPICKQAEAEGWARELRAALIHSIRQQMFQGQEIDVAKAMPPERWIKATRHNALRYELSAKWRDRAVEECGSVDRFLQIKRPGNGGVSKHKLGSWTRLGNVDRPNGGDHE
jgi:hypothetical protein